MPRSLAIVANQPAPTTLTQHPKARKYRYLFEGVTAFKELEARIAALMTNKERGDAFEVFVGLYLTVCGLPAPTAIHYSPFPRAVAEQLGVPEAQDLGIDSVYATSAGLTAAQAKFRADRGTLSLSELATFFAVSERADFRLVVTNASGTSGKLGSCGNFAAILGNTLDALTEDDFDSMRALLEGGALPEPRKPRDDQLQAVRKTEALLRERGRAKVLMACGTGKTVVQVELSKALRPENLVVLVPSLALIRQHLREWKRSGELNHRELLVVCSDSDATQVIDIDDDELRISKDDVGAHVSTEVAEIANFLVSGRRPVALFCTYHSTPLLAQALPAGFRFDLGVFDEAHRTAGTSLNAFSTALRDSSIPIAQRAFFTATPRHIERRLLRQMQAADLAAYSMDDESVYGSTAFELPLRAAAEQGIICHYKVIVAVVTNAQVAEAALRVGQVMLGGAAVDAKAVAYHLAVAKAMNDFGLKKGIAYFSRVAHAKQFAASAFARLYDGLAPVELSSVSGSMLSSRRDSILQRFSDAPCAVVSNARCLSEGVDVPAVDFVAFMAPKRSRIDIVQSIGRALRKDPANPDKHYGYVVLPLFVDEAAGESLQTAIARCDFEDICVVLHALMQQDETLEDVLGDLKVDLAAGRTLNWAGLARSLSISTWREDIALADIQAGIVTRLVEGLGDSWDVLFGMVRDCVGENGWQAVQAHPEAAVLRRWLDAQRRLWLNGGMLASRRARLDALGFSWDPILPAWQKTLEKLRAHRQRPSEKDAGKLERWVAQQVSKFHKGLLSGEKKALLDALDVDFSIRPLRTKSSSQEETLQEARAYFDRHGHCVLPTSADKNSLHARLLKLRDLAKSKPSSSLYQALKPLGVFEAPGSLEWENHFAAWKRYVQATGDRTLARIEDADLLAWAGEQRALIASLHDALAVPVPQRYAKYADIGYSADGCLELQLKMRKRAIAADMRSRHLRTVVANRLLREKFQ